MHITKQQLKVLERYVRNRDTNPTAFGIFHSNLRLYAYITLYFLACGALFYWLVGPWFAAFAGVAYVITLHRDFAHFRQSAAVWPVIREITDWSKVDSIIARQESA